MAKLEEKVAKAAVIAAMAPEELELYNASRVTEITSKSNSKVNAKLAARKVAKPINGRQKILRLMDAILEQPEVQQALSEALVHSILAGDKQAIDQLRNTIMPLMPKELLIRDESEQKQEQKLGVRIVLAGAAGTMIDVTSTGGQVPSSTGVQVPAITK